MLSVNGNALEVEVVGEKILRKTSLFGNSRKLSARMDTEVQEAFKLFDKDKVKFNQVFQLVKKLGLGLYFSL